MSPQPIYLDNNATTAVDPRVLEAMLPSLTGAFGNAASRTHAYGAAAWRAVEGARAQVAALIGASAAEIVWTSGATESDNLGLKGVALRGIGLGSASGRHVITTDVEHKAVLDTCKDLERRGARVTYLQVGRTGQIDAAAIEAAIEADTVLVSVMHANNETGTVNDIAAIGQVCKARGVLFHTDAAQSVGRIPVDVEAMGIDLLSLSGHKLYGPKGVGALYVRRKRPRVRCTPQMHGGGHERGLRSGTLNVPGVVGLGAACRLAAAEMAEEAERLAALRDRLWAGLCAGLPDARRNGHPTRCLPNTLNVSFPGVSAVRLMGATPAVALSSGSACITASFEPSYVLRALGLTDESALSSIRFSLGRFNTAEEIDAAVEAVVASVRRLRASAAVPHELAIREPGADPHDHPEG